MKKEIMIIAVSAMVILFLGSCNKQLYPGQKEGGR